MQSFDLVSLYIGAMVGSISLLLAYTIANTVTSILRKRGKNKDKKGSKKSKKITKEKYNKLLRNYVTTVSLAIFVLLLMSASLLITLDGSMYNVFSEYSYTAFEKINGPDIEYVNLNVEEIKLVDDVIKQVNPLYLANQRKIVIMENISKYCGDSCGGLNILKESYVEFYNDTEVMKMLICHELMHSFIYKSNVGHKVVYDLGEKQVCFTNNTSPWAEHLEQRFTIEISPPEVINAITTTTEVTVDKK